jgi:hypothetical protein
MDRLEAVHLFIDYLYDCRANGRFDALETLCYAWKNEASSKEFLALGQRFARLAEGRRSGVVIDLADRVRQRNAL